MGDTNAPEIIYLQDGGRSDELDAVDPILYDDCVTWCTDAIEDDDTKYIRFDLHERELASLRQKQVLWEAGNRELADRLEARDVAIDALRAECDKWKGQIKEWREANIQLGQRAERAEAENAELHKMLLEKEDAFMVQGGMLIKAEAERDAALKDAALWRKHSDVVKATYVPGALHVRVTMSAEASRTEKCWQVEYVISTDEMESGVLKNHIIGMKTEQKVAELFAAIDAARKVEQ